MTDRGGRRARAWRDDRMWQAGFLVGSALGAAATVLGRRAERAARAGGLVDWAGVERTAIARLRHSPGSLPVAELRAAEPYYRRHMERIVPALEARLETDLPGIVERSEVVDRAGWVRANTASLLTVTSGFGLLIVGP